MNENQDAAVDVVVIGGGAAGLSGAVTLARSRRSVVVVDAGEPRNAPAAGVHALLGREGIAPAELLERGRAELEGYGGTILRGEVVRAAADADGFAVTLADGRAMRARRLLVTTGLVDELPSVPGLRERWGRDVLHCPYCHGWEVRDRAIGILATTPTSVHQALLFRQLSDDVVYLAAGVGMPEAEDAEKLQARGIRIIEGEITGLHIVDDRLSAVRLSDGAVIARDALAVGSRMVARSAVFDDLGLQPTSHPMGEFIAVDATGRTAVAGVWAAGNVSDLSAQVGMAAAQGTFAAAQLNADLVAEDVQIAVTRHRERGKMEAWSASRTSP
ncbi:NAD(P)/FAD-dependent oxidoreductase [Microbacterium sp. DT81.1]|uniref:NAD(P)/FAD-dependent oxidoreductase n=1 Tax=Microbacterium sp. DT81.1 TaxID=3393413 RepID=UPI003CF4D0BD